MPFQWFSRSNKPTYNKGREVGPFMQMGTRHLALARMGLPPKQDVTGWGTLSGSFKFGGRQTFQPLQTRIDPLWGTDAGGFYPTGLTEPPGG